MLRNFHILLNEPETFSIFSDNTLVFFRQKKISGSVWYTALYSKTVQSLMAHSLAALANAKHAFSPTPTLSPNSQFFIRLHFTCLSSSLIYCISCSKCGLLYVGETGRSLKVRFGEHRRSVNNHDNTKPVARHFTSGNHCVWVMKIRALCPISGTNNSRKRQEMSTKMADGWWERRWRIVAIIRASRLMLILPANRHFQDQNGKIFILILRRQ